MLGLSTRKYGQAVREFAEAYGLEKSAISEHFIEASREKLKAMMERRLEKMRLCALLIDATPFAGQQMVAALGISQDERKTILGLRQGATKNATVMGELLGDLMNRGLDFSEPRLYVLDGGEALHAAVKKHGAVTCHVEADPTRSLSTQFGGAGKCSGRTERECMAPSWHLERVLLGEFGNGMVEPSVYGRRQQRLWMRREGKQPSSRVVSSNGMNGRKREGTVEIPRGRRTLRRRKRTHKAKAEVVHDAGWEVGRGHSVATAHSVL